MIINVLLIKEVESVAVNPEFISVVVNMTVELSLEVMLDPDVIALGAKVV